MTKSLPNGTWQRLEYTSEQANGAMKKHNWSIFPSQDVLVEHGYGGLASAVQHHGGFYDFREILGQPNERKKHGSWQQLSFAVDQAHLAMKKHGWLVLPSNSVLEKHRYGSLISSIRKYHGGIIEFRKMLGHPQRTIKPGTWKKLSFAVEQAQMVMEKNQWDILPGSHVLHANGYSSLGGAIVKYHGGYHKFRETLGEVQSREKKGCWKNLSFVIERLRIAMKKHGWQVVPGKKILVKNGYSGLAGGIVKHHGGLPAFRDKMAHFEHLPSEKEQLEELLRDYTRDEH